MFGSPPHPLHTKHNHFKTMAVDDVTKTNWFPSFITKLERDGSVDPVINALDALRGPRRQNVLRQLETAIHAETLDMKQDEHLEFKTRTSCPKSKNGVYMSILLRHSGDPGKMYWGMGRV